MHEENDIELEEADPSDQIKKLKEKLKTSQKERQEFLDGWQRAKADLINARKRDEEDKRNFARIATEDLIHELIPVLSSFDSAMANKDAWEKVDKNWRTGVEYIANQLRKALTDHGLVEINPLGEKFDPQRDEPVAHVRVDEEKNDQRIMEVVQKGYSLNGKTLKAPRVKVGELGK